MVGAGAGAARLLGVDAVGARAAAAACARREMEMEMATVVVAVARRSLSGTATSSIGNRRGTSRRWHAQGLPMADRNTPRGASSSRWSGSGVKASGYRSSSTTSSSASTLMFTSPPEELEDGFVERPTPLLLVAGEGQPSTWWSGATAYFAARGCTVGAMVLTGRGNSPTETLTLRALQAGVAAAIDKSGLTPPVIVAHSMAGFVCQQYLQSYSASGLVLLDSFPPEPGALACEHLRLALARAGDHELAPDQGMGIREVAQLMKDDPARWEGLLRRHFAEFHERSPFQAPTTVEGRQAAEDGDHRFPVKAFAQMCLGQPSSTLRLESHVVETLVLGSADNCVGSGVFGGAVDDDDLAAFRGAVRYGLEAICEFHGVDGWSWVEGGGLVAGSSAKVTAGVGVDTAETSTTWQEAVWGWYDARF